MNNLIVLLVAVIAFTNAEPLLGGILGNAGVLSGNDLGGTIGGIGGATDIIGDANGITGGLTDVNGAIVDLGGILDLKATKCLKKCPMQVANPDIKCITPTMYPGFPICYARNINNKNIWPCQEKNVPRYDDE